MDDTFQELSGLVKEMGFNTIPDSDLRELLQRYQGDCSKVFEYLMDTPLDNLNIHITTKPPLGIHSQVQQIPRTQDRWTGKNIDQLFSQFQQSPPHPPPLCPGLRETEQIDTKLPKINISYEPSAKKEATIQEKNHSEISFDPSNNNMPNFLDSSTSGKATNSTMPLVDKTPGSESFDLDRKFIQSDFCTMTTLFDPSVISKFLSSRLLINDDGEFLNTAQPGHGAIVYFTAESTPEEREEQARIVSLFRQEAIPFVEVDLTHEYEQTGLIMAKLNGVLNLPIVFLSNKLIGKYEQVRLLLAQIKYECAEQLVKSVTWDDYRHLNAVSNCDIQLGLIDKVLNVGEVLINYLNPLSWFGRNIPYHSSIMDENNVEEFTVIQSNWYMRHQKRILRFGPETFMRLHPETRQVRAAYRYTSLKQILQIPDQRIVLTYTHGQKDYFKAPREVISHLVALFLVRCGPTLELKVSTTSLKG